MARLRDTDHEPLQRDVHPGTTSVHRFPATFSDDIGGGRALMVSVALSEHIWDFSVRLCSGTLPQRGVKSYKKLYYTTSEGLTRLKAVLHGLGQLWPSHGVLDGGALQTIMLGANGAGGKIEEKSHRW